MLCISVHSRVAGPACFGMYTHAESGRQTIVHFLRRSRVIIAIYSIRYMSPWHDLVVLSECFGCIRSCFETLDRVPSHCPYKRKRKKKKCSALPSVIIQWFSYAFFSFIESIRIEKCRWSIETRYQCVLYATVNSQLIDSRSRSSICEKCESEHSRGERVHVHRRTMAELRVYRFFVILVHLAVVLVLAQNPIEEKTTFEAAFQGKIVIKIIINHIYRSQCRPPTSLKMYSINLEGMHAFLLLIDLCFTFSFLVEYIFIIRKYTCLFLIWWWFNYQIIHERIKNDFTFYYFVVIYCQVLWRGKKWHLKMAFVIIQIF